MNAKEELEKAVEEGRMAFAGWQGPVRPVVDHSWVEKHVLGGKAVRAVQIQDAVIKGMLDLRDARGPSGEPCCALTLENCVLEGDPGSQGSDPGIDASHSHLQRLSLVGCETNGAEVSGAVIVGDLTLDGIHGQGKVAACWVKARDLRVGGSVTARRAKLRLPWPAGAEWPPSQAPNWSDLRAPFGLDLQGADIAGSLILQPRFESVGGVNVSGATIGGSLWAQGAHLDAADLGRDAVEALRAQSVEINGHAMFGCDSDYISEGTCGVCGRFHARGKLDFLGAKIGGWLWFAGSKVTYEGDPALYLYSATVSTDIRLDRDDAARMPCEIPTIDLSSADIAGLLLIEGSDATPIRRVDATGVRTGGNLTILGSVSEISVGTASIGGAVSIEASDKTPIQHLDAAGLRVAGDLTLCGSVSEADLSASVIHGGLALGSDDLALRLTSEEGSPRLALVGASVGRSLRVVTPVRTQEIVVKGMRSTTLSCYPGWRLAEIAIAPGNRLEVAVMAVLHRPRGSKVIVLDGKAARLHDLNTTRTLRLGTSDQAMEYLSLFCNYVWADKGAFRIVEPTEGGAPTRTSRNAPWQVRAIVDYGEDRFEAGFEITASGDVRMTDDSEIGRASEAASIVYEPPLRWIIASTHWPLPSPFGLNLTEGDAGVPRAVLEKFPRPEIDLQGLKIGGLDDDDGEMWWSKRRGLTLKPRLSLAGFEYDRIDQPSRQRISGGAGAYEEFEGATRDQEQQLVERRRRLVERRRRWLRSQYTDDPPAERDYRPQPYQQLAKVWRAEGRFDEADKIAYDKLELEKVRIPRPPPSRSRRWTMAAAALKPAAVASVVLWLVAWLGLWVPPDVVGFVTVVLVAAAIVVVVADSVPIRQRLWKWFVQWPFGFGLRPQNALMTLVVFWMVGVGATIALQWRDVIKVDASPVATVVSQGGSERVVVEEQPILAPREEVECRDHISAMVYPLDAMIPLVDLRQEFRCQLSIKGEAWPFFDWGLAKGVYSVVGWLVLIGFIVTASGVVRRRIEG